MNNEYTTDNPLLSDATVQEDYNHLPDYAFASKYGADTLAAFNSQHQAALENASSILAGNSRTWGEAVTDTGRNVATGAVSGVTDTLSAGTAILGAQKAAEYLARASEGIRDWGERNGSLGQRAMASDYAYNQDKVTKEANREYQRDIAEGMDPDAAARRRELKIFGSSVGNALTTGYGHQIAAQGLGSIGTGIATSGAISALGRLGAKAIAKTAPKVLESAKNAYSASNPVVQKIADATPWMASMGLQEGGGAFSQTYLQGLDMSHDDLMANSPAYVQSYMKYVAEDRGETEAREMARRDLAFEAGKQAGVETGITAGILNAATAGLARPFQRAGSKYVRGVGEALTEPLEETLTEGTSQYTQNRAVKAYLNQNQDLYEGLGQGAAEGLVGGLGVVGARAVPPVAVEGAIATAKGAKSAITGIKDVASDTWSNVTTPDNEATQNIISNLQANLNSIATSTASTSEENIASVVNGLQEVKDSLGTKVKTEEGTEVNSVTPEEALASVEKTEHFKEVLDNQTAIEGKETVVKNSVKASKKAIKGIQAEAAKVSSTQIAKQRQSYTEGTVLTPEQLNAEGANLILQQKVNPSKASKEFNSLPAGIKEQITSAEFTNPQVAEGIRNLNKITLEPSAPEIPSTSIPTQTSIKPSSTQKAEAPIRISLNSSNEMVKGIEDVYGAKAKFTPVTEKSFEGVDTSGGNAEEDLGEGVKLIKYANKEGNLSKLTVKFNGKELENDDVINDLFISSLNASPKQATKIVSELVERARGALDFLGSIDVGEGKQEIAVLGNDLIVDGKSYQISEATQKILQDPLIPMDQKKLSIANEVRDNVTRSYISLDPAKLKEQHKYFDAESGEVIDLDKEEVSQSFSNLFNGLSKIFTPVRRSTHLWQDSNPVEAFRRIVRSPKALQDYLRANHLTNASALDSALYFDSLKNERNERVDSGKAYFDPNDTIAQQLYSLLNPNSNFHSLFSEQLDKAFADKPLSKDLQDILYENGKLNPRIKGILTLSALHQLASLGAFPHELNRDELARLGIDSELQTEEFIRKTGMGVPSDMAVHNTATTIRKMLGVGENPDAKLSDVENVLGSLALKLNAALMDSGMLQKQEASYTVRNSKGKPEARTMVLLSPSEEFSKLFRPKATVILQLVDPTMKNAWHTTPPEVKNTYANSGERINSKTRKAIEKANHMPASLNPYFLKFLGAIGGEEGIALLEDTDNKNFLLPAEYTTRKGKNLTRRLGFDYVREVLLSNPDVKSEDIVTYFSNVAIKNNRIMQEGAATPQSNKLLRQAVNFLNSKEHDLTNEKVKQIWKTTLAQKLGVKVNAVPLSEYESKIDSTLNWVERTTGTGKYKEFFDSMFSSDPRDIFGTKGTEGAKIFKELVNQFNKNSGGWKISDAEGFNALIEMVRYVRASEAERKKFDSRIFLEIDGTNDGPSYLNALFSLGVTGPTESFLSGSAKTGNYYGIDTISQEALSNQEVKDQYGIDTGDFHSEVSKKELVKNFFNRVVAFNTDSQNVHKGKDGIRVTQQMLKLFHAVGWINPAEGKDKNSALEAINNLGNIKSFDPEDLPFSFDRSVSKHLVTIIGYGSGDRNATRNVVEEMLHSLYSKLSNELEPVIRQIQEGKTVDPSSIKLNGVSYPEVMKSLRNLINTTYDKENVVFNTLTKRSDKETFNLYRHLTDKLPTTEQLKITSKDENTGVIRSKITPEMRTKADGDIEYLRFLREVNDIRNFRVMPAGINALTDVLVPVFGEPAVAAVKKTIGTSAMQGMMFPTVVSNLLNRIAKNYQKILFFKDPSIYKNLTYKQKFDLERKVAETAPIFNLSGGTKVVIGKSTYASEEDGIKDSDRNMRYVSSRNMITDAGVSGAPLITQSVGDATTAVQTLNEISEIINFSQVFDGMYVDPTNASELSKVLNKSSWFAQNQKPMGAMFNRLEQVGRRILDTKEWNVKAESPVEAVLEVISRIASGKNIDGSVTDGSSAEMNSIQTEINRAIEDLNGFANFEANLFKSSSNKKQKNLLTRSSNYGSKESLSIDTKNKLKNLFNTLEAMTISEDLSHQVLKSLPKSIHHMAGEGTSYKEGKLLSVEEAKDLVNRVNDLNQDKKFNNFSELLATYLQIRMDHLVERIKPFEGKPEVKAKWEDLTGRFNSSSGSRNLLSEEALDLLNKEFNTRVPVPEIVRPTGEIQVRTNGIAALKQAIASIKERTGAFAPVYSSLMNRLEQRLPEDLRVVTVKSIGDIDNVFVKKRFLENSATKGMYHPASSTIYILDRGNKQNMETLAHEAIHAAVSTGWITYFADKKRKADQRVLSEEQTVAFRNLEALVNSFIKEAKNPTEDSPLNNQVVQNFLKIVEDNQGSARMDEAMAYLLSNQVLFNQLAQWTPKNASYHRSRLKKLFIQMLKVAKDILKKILGVVRGSPMDKMVDAEDVKDFFKTPSSFIQLYGINSRIAFGKETDRTGGDPEGINSDITRPMISLGDLTVAPSKNRFEFYDKKMVGRAYLKALASQKRPDGVNVNRLGSQLLSGYTRGAANFIAGVYKNIFPYLRDGKRTTAMLTFMASLMYPETIPAELRTNLSYLYADTASKLKREHLLKDFKNASKQDRETALALYKILKGDVPLFTGELQEDMKDQKNMILPAFFLALRAAYPEYTQNLPNAKAEFINKNSKFKDGWEYLTDKINKSLAETKISDKPIDDVLEEVKDKILFTPPSSDNVTKANKIVDSINEKILWALLLPFKKTKIAEAIREIHGFAGDTGIGYGTWKVSQEILRRLANNTLGTTAASYIKELYGRTPSMANMEHFLKEIKGFYDRIRKENLEEIPELLSQAFTRRVDRKLKNFLHGSVGRADISTMEFMDVKDMVLNDSYETKIAELEAELSDLNPDLSKKWIAKAKQLANYLTGTRESGRNLLTNGLAIARLLGEGGYYRIKEDTKGSPVQVIDRLITAYSLNNLSKADKDQLKDLFKNEEEGMHTLHNQMREVLKQEKNRDPKAWQENAQNRLHGWFPKGDQPKGLYTLVPESKVKKLESEGYVNLGVYEASSIDSSEPYYRMWHKNNQEATFVEGLMQTIHKTVGGFHTTQKTRNEAIGTRILDSVVANNILSNYQLSQDKNLPIPIYNASGTVIGYERAIPAEDRYLLEGSDDLFSGIAQYRVRQERENIADNINKKAVDIAWEDWNNAPKTAKDGFVDLFRIEDPAIRNSVSKLDPNTVKYIKEKFGEHFWVRKDSIWTYVGYDRVSLTDMYDGNFILPKKVQEYFVKVWDKIFFNGKGKYVLAGLEKALMGATTFARETIVIRSGIIPVINALSNMVILHVTLGMPPREIYRLYKESFAETKEYNRISERVRKLTFDRAKDGANVKAIDTELRLAKIKMESLSIYPFVRRGEYSTISMEGVEYEEVDMWKQNIDESLSSALANVPGGEKVKSALSELLMLKGSSSYAQMAEFTNLGDWLAKVAGYRYLTEPSEIYNKKVLDPEQARDIVSALFVDYDQIMGRELEWSNKIGFTWFMSYKLRMIPAAILSLTLNPVRVLLGAAMTSYLNFGGLPISENVFAKLLGGDLWYSTGWDMLLRGMSMHPLATVLSLGK